MGIQGLITLHYICLLERRKLLILIAMSVQFPQLAGYLWTGNPSNFLYVEDSAFWLNDCPQFLSTYFEADKCFDRILSS